MSAKEDQAFVAMSFRHDIRFILDEAIEPALTTCGYKAKVVNKNPNDLKTIDDEILSGIRESALVVVDFTHERPNVYFEVGFAMGLGIPVVRTKRANEEPPGLHFDQDHYPVHRWTDAGNLQKILSDHIRVRRQGQVCVMCFVT